MFVCQSLAQIGKFTQVESNSNLICGGLIDQNKMRNLSAFTLLKIKQSIVAEQITIKADVWCSLMYGLTCAKSTNLPCMAGVFCRDRGLVCPFSQVFCTFISHENIKI